ncbi:MAG: amidohydrolase family protein, partial [Acidobacteria bacterium]|nr:amidohydrolase family protein [Acidobacteriota bacterium]
MAAMILRGARVALGPERTARLDLEIGGPETRLDLEGYLILPGLINAHDHLEFALFPRLGRRVYPNAGEWARDIFRPQESPVREHLRVPKSVRLVWGGLRNLLAGVTTVCHHNPRAAVFDRDFPVRVVKRFGWAHSLRFSPDLAERFRATPDGWPFVVHLGEATDSEGRREGRREIGRLDRMGALDARTVLVHAVALDRRGWRLVRERGASVVWCPSSNLFTLGRTLDPAAIPAGVRVALGTDSPLTAKGDLLDELRLARRVSGLPKTALYQMVLEEPARILRLGSRRDLIAFRDRGQ